MVSSTTRKRGSLMVWALSFLFAISQFGCAPIRLVSDYDETIDKGVSIAQRDTETFLVKLESVASNDNAQVAAYNGNNGFYKEMKISISALRIRADATDRNSLTVQMLDRLQNALNLFEQAHKEGMIKKEINSFRGGFNSAFTAILTFELAKKRGEKPDPQKANVSPTPVLVQSGAAK